ncbi:hypothetical protein PVL29_011075 [Vitis rotundifolia]|uniref:F-box domain-containing protein n=1 Tax=Vitis rotundifolia TaxID=103349 RepID=A0AA39DTV6_VITRO|nr:hypothetical protein PVL29_011075 [Vitis rotundifolia]
MASHSILTVDKIRKRKRSWRPWSNLPEDLVRLVVERLYLVDRIHLHAVCKNWLASPIHDIPLIDKLPWIMYYCFSPHHTICSFFEPCRKLPYILGEERGWDDERGWITAESLLSRATAYASRCGWVLFSEKIREVFNSTLYHAYQPRLEHDCHFERLATFSSDPTSSDCVIIAPTIYGEEYLFISAYSIGNKTWKTPPPAHAMAYMAGSVYCYNVGGGLSSFHIATQEWRLLSNESPLIDDGINASDFVIGTWYFVAYGGHLHLVSLTELEADMVPECKILKYDWLDGAWRKMKSLEGGVIFVGKPSFGVSAGEQTKMVANRVYYSSSHTSKPNFLVYGSVGMGEKSEFSRNQQIYYEPRLEKSQSLEESRSWKWMEPPLLTY